MSASTITIADATTQAMIADGPAIEAAVSAPNSHPEPMIDPSYAHSRPRNPTPRSIPSPSSSATFAGGALAAASFSSTIAVS
jgi:hypothetical protein